MVLTVEIKYGKDSTVEMDSAYQIADVLEKAGYSSRRIKVKAQ